MEQNTRTIGVRRRTSNDIQGADDEVPLRFGVHWLPCCSGHPPCQLLRHNADASVEHGLGKILKSMTCAQRQSKVAQVLEHACMPGTGKESPSIGGAGGGGGLCITGKV